MSRLVTFSISERARQILDKFPWGEKSKLISDYIETLDHPKAEAMKQNPELPQNPKIHQHLAQEYADSKTQSEQAEISAKKPSSKSSATPNTSKPSSIHSLLEALKPQTQKKNSPKSSESTQTKNS